MSGKFKKADIKQAVKIGCAIENKTISELARLIGREQSTLSGMLSRGKPTIKTLMEIIDGLNAKLLIEYSNGHKVELKIKKE